MAKAQHWKRYRHVPAVMKEMRHEAQMSQRELAAELDKPQSWVHNCECGNRRVDIAEYFAWAEACGIDRMRAIGLLLEIK